MSDPADPALSDAPDPGPREPGQPPTSSGPAEPPPAAGAPPASGGLDAALPASGGLDEIASHTWKIDLVASFLGAGVTAVIEMGSAIAKKGFNATDTEVAWITSGQSLGLILSFFTAHWASLYPKVPLVFWPELAGRLALCLLFFLKPGFSIAFVVVHILAQIVQQMTIPPRVTIYRLNYPDGLRGRIVGRNRQVQLSITTVISLLLSSALDWCSGQETLVAWLGRAPVDPIRLLNYTIPAIAGAGLLGSFFFRRIRVRNDLVAPGGGSLLGTMRRFYRIWRGDREFRRYQFFFLIFGFANIMTIPLTQIHAVDVLHADYFDLALINVVLVQGLMAATLPSWGKLVDRYPPTVLRGILNLIFSIDLLLLAVSPSLGWVFAGRVCRGIALGGGTLIWMLGSLYYARSQEEVPVYLGIHSVMTGFRWAIAPFVGVWMKNSFFGRNARPVFFICFVIIVLTALWMIFDSRKQPPRKALGGSPPMPAPRTPGA